MHRVTYPIPTGLRAQVVASIVHERLVGVDSAIKVGVWPSWLLLLQVLLRHRRYMSVLPLPANGSSLLPPVQLVLSACLPLRRWWCRRACSCRDELSRLWSSRSSHTCSIRSSSWRSREAQQMRAVWQARELQCMVIQL